MLLMLQAQVRQCQLSGQAKSVLFRLRFQFRTYANKHQAAHLPKIGWGIIYRTPCCLVIPNGYVIF